MMAPTLSARWQQALVHKSPKTSCAQKPKDVLLQMDFISKSRCMLLEGGEVWINITAPVYDMILQQAQEQGFRIMLPITKPLHEIMQGSRYLRGFYVLGGSLHDATIDSNCVSIICVMANKLQSADDDAGLDSAMNHTPTKETFALSPSLSQCSTVMVLRLSRATATTASPFTSTSRKGH